MVAKTETRKTSVAEYIKIRRYVVAMIAKSGRKQEMIPSNRELERNFGVSRPTVQRALADLVSSGYLIAKPGIGTFTNPEGGLGNFSGYRRVGVIVGDGKLSIYDRFLWNLSNCVAEQLLKRRRDYYIQPCDLINSGEKQLEEIVDYGLAGLIWVNPNPESCPLLTRLKTEFGLPVVSIGRMVESVSSYVIDDEQAVHEVAKTFLKQGREKFFFIYYECSMKGVDGARRACAEAGIPFSEKQAVAANGATLDNIERMLDLGMHPDGIIAWAQGPQLLDLLRRKGIDLVKDCPLATNNWVLSDDVLDEGVLICEHDFNLMAERAAANLAAQCEGAACETASELLPFTLMWAEDARSQTRRDI